MALWGAKGDRQQGIKTQQSFLLLLDPQLNDHQPGIKLKKKLGQCWLPGQSPFLCLVHFILQILVDILKICISVYTILLMFLIFLQVVSYIGRVLQILGDVNNSGFKKGCSLALQPLLIHHGHRIQCSNQDPQRHQPHLPVYH